MDKRYKEWKTNEKLEPLELIREVSISDAQAEDMNKDTRTTRLKYIESETKSDDKERAKELRGILKEAGVKFSPAAPLDVLESKVAELNK